MSNNPLKRKLPFSPSSKHNIQKRRRRNTLSPQISIVITDKIICLLSLTDTSKPPRKMRWEFKALLTAKQIRYDSLKWEELNDEQKLSVDDVENGFGALKRRKFIIMNQENWQKLLQLCHDRVVEVQKNFDILKSKFGPEISNNNDVPSSQNDNNNNNEPSESENDIANAEEANIGDNNEPLDSENNESENAEDENTGNNNDNNNDNNDNNNNNDSAQLEKKYEKFKNKVNQQMIERNQQYNELLDEIEKIKAIIGQPPQILQPDQIEISDFQTIDEENDDNDDDDEEICQQDDDNDNNKNRPQASWVNNIKKRIKSQKQIAPALIFGPPPTQCNLAQIFCDFPQKEIYKIRKTTSDWIEDKPTDNEIEEYNDTMNFL